MGQTAESNMKTRKAVPSSKTMRILIELIGATAIIDFANKADNAIKPKERTEYFDFGIQHEDQSVDIRHFLKVPRIPSCIRLRCLPMP